jgi:replicative DNA helicase
MVAAVPSIIERLPPHNVEAEQSVLGSLLIDRDAIIQVASFLRPEDFYAAANSLIYRAILDLYNKREPTDFVTLSDELQRRGQYDQAGGLSYLSSLLNAVPTAVHVEYYARIVERAATLRRLIDAGTEIVDVGFREGIDTQDALDAAERAVFAVSQRRQSKDFVSMGDVLDRFFDQIDYLQQHRGEVVGVATGFSDLDQLTGGLQRSDLIIVAARPSMGKTSLALGMAYGAAVGHGKTVGIFSLEMSAEQLVQRVLSMETGVDTHRLRLGQIDDNEWDRISRAFGRLSEAPIYIDDASTSNIMDVRSKARRLQAEHGLDLIIVDYLQLMTARRTENRVQEISEISRGLKGLARELNVPVVALSQLSRAVESRSDHKPMLSDLRESGSIEQDADIVVFIYREDKYEEDSEKKGIAEIIVSKHRNGPVGSINLRFFDRTARFADLELYPGPGM